MRNLKTLGSGAFQYCTGIKEAVYPPQLKKIPSNLYYGCTGLTELIIPETVSCIGSNAFGSCSSLERVVLNTGVTELEESAFSECSSLSKVFVSNALKMDSDVFYKCPEDIEFYFDHSQSYFETYSDIDSYNADFTDAEHFYQELTTVILNPNEGVGGVFGETSRPYAIEKKTGEPFIVSGESEYIPVVNGEKFMGWNAMPDGSGITYMPGDEYTGITTLNLYAQWNSSEILRLSGSTRNGTAVAISEWLNDYVVECDAVVLANGWDFADALAGGPLAKSLGATILLITGDESDEATFDEIERIGAKDIYILGGTVAVSEDVEERLEGDHNIIRIAGSNRFETAVKIAEEIEKHFAETCGNAFFAYSHNYPDALAVSGIAAIDGAPILYIGSDGVLDSATAAYVKKCKFKNAYVLGGTGAIDAAAETNIKKAGAKHVDRIAGATRYETCLEINKAFSYLFGDGTTAYAMCVSTGTNFPDALAGSVLAAWYNSPMLLVAPDEPLSAAQKKYADDTLDKEYSCIIIFGGKGAVPEAIENELKGLIGLD